MTLRLRIQSPEKAPYAAVITRTQTSSGHTERLAVIEPGEEADVYVWSGVSLTITEQPAAPAAVAQNPEPATVDPAANS